MKRFFGFAIILALFCVPAFAAKNSDTMNLATTVKVGSTLLPAGNYKLTWTGTGSNVQLTLAQKGKATVTVPAKVVEAKNDHVGLTTDTVNGVEVLEGIQLNKLNIEIVNAPAPGE